MTKAIGRHLPKSRMGKAISYVPNHWHDLVRFINDGCIDLDKNSVERMFKPNICCGKMLCSSAAKKALWRGEFTHPLSKLASSTE